MGVAPSTIDGFNANIIRVMREIFTATEAQQWT